MKKKDPKSRTLGPSSDEEQGKGTPQAASEASSGDGGGKKGRAATSTAKTSTAKKATSRDKKGTGPTETAPEKTGPTKTGPDKTEPDKTEPDETDRAQKKGSRESSPTEDAKPQSASAKKGSLPAFGFAADLLKKKSAGDDGDKDPSPTATAEVSAVNEATDADESFDPSRLDQDPLDPTAPSRIFDFADHLADEDREEAEAVPVRLETFVTFDLAGETFAMPVEPVRQVVRVASITRVPHAPRPIRGVTNLRGRVIPVVDLRLRVGLPETETDRSARVIAVASRGRLLGLLVDAVYQVVRLDLNRVQPPPDDVMTLQSDYIRGVYHLDEELILLLDVDRALIVREAGAA